VILRDLAATLRQTLRPHARLALERLTSGPSSSIRDCVAEDGTTAAAEGALVWAGAEHRSHRPARRALTRDGSLGFSRMWICVGDAILAPGTRSELR